MDADNPLNVCREPPKNGVRLVSIPLLAVGIALSPLYRSVSLSRNYAESVKKSTATIENITPPTQRDLGGVRVYLVEVTFRLDEYDDQSSIATQVCFEDLDKVWGISHDTGRLLKLDWSKSVYPVENGVFVAALPADPGWMIGKRFSVMLPNVSD